MSHPRDRPAARAAIALLVGAAAWAGAVVVGPAIASTAGAASPAAIASVAIYGAGGLVCHQQAGRSFQGTNRRWPVCARCAGLYLSAGIGSLLLLASRRWWRHRAAGPAAPIVYLLLTAAVPTVVSWFLERLGLIVAGNMLRAVLAAPLGLAASGLLAYVWQAAGPPDK